MQSKSLTTLAVSKHKLSAVNIQLDLLSRLLQFELSTTHQTEEVRSISDDDLENLLDLIETAADYADLLFRNVSTTYQILPIKSEVNNNIRPR